jgi:hypothetical protein
MAALGSPAAVGDHNPLSLARTERKMDEANADLAMP